MGDEWRGRTPGGFAWGADGGRPQPETGRRLARGAGQGGVARQTAPAGRQATLYSRYTVANFRSHAPFGGTIDAEKPDYALLHAAVHFVTNEARVRQGKRALPHHPRLEKTAFDYAREMVAKDFYDHRHPSDPAQRGPSDRGKRAGIKNAALAENLAIAVALQYEEEKGLYVMDAAKGLFSQVSPDGPAAPMHTYLSLAQALVDKWMKSPGHRANILSDNSRSLGCGAYLFRDRKFRDILSVKAVQVFQLYADVKE